MKKSIYSFLAIAVSVLLTCCTAENLNDEQPLGEGVPFRITASFADTKTVLSEDRSSVLWCPGDEVSVFYGASSIKCTSLCTKPSATSIFEASRSVFFFGNEGSDGYLWSVYPYSADNEYDNNKVTLTVPTQQKGVAGSFGPGTFPSIGRSHSTVMPFYNLCGGVTFRLQNSDIKKIVLRSRGGQVLTGTVRATFDENERPVVDEVLQGRDSVVLTLDGGAAFTPGVSYYLSVLPTSLADGITFQFICDSRRGTRTSTNSFTVTRSKFGNVGVVDATAEWENYNDCIALTYRTTAANQTVALFADGRFPGGASNSLVSIDYGDGTSGDSREHVYAVPGEYNAVLHYASAVTEIGAHAFENIATLVGIRVPDLLSQIGEYAFHNSGLENLALPDTGITVNHHAFCGCRHFNSVSIPASTDVKSAAFSQINATDFYVDCNINKDCNQSQLYNTELFASHSTITTLTIGQHVTYIDDYVFNHSDISNVIFEDGSQLYQIGDGFLLGNNAIQTITVPYSIEEFSPIGAFCMCPNLASIYVDGHYCSDGVLRREKNGYTSIFKYPEGKIADEFDATGYGEFFEYAFSRTHLVRIVGEGPAMYGDVPDYCFAFSENLEYISWFDAVDSRFNVLASPPTSIGTSAFRQTAITYAIIPASVTSIGSYAFEGCPQLKSVTVRATTPPELGAYAFDNNAEGRKIYVPEDLVETYRTAPGWSEYASDIVGYGYVDMGLSVEWATCNLGSDTPEGAGDPYAWGETETKSAFGDWNNYAMGDGFMALTSYCPDRSFGRDGSFNNKLMLEPEHDAASCQLGDHWRMPTEAEIKELTDPANCDWVRETLNGVDGWRVTSLRSGHENTSIFIPDSDYWSSCLGAYPPYGYAVRLSSDGTSDNIRVDRCSGLKIRPVRGTSQLPSGVTLRVFQDVDAYYYYPYSWLQAASGLNLYAHVSPSTASQSVYWTSDNESIATVNSSGYVTFVSRGTTTIRATTANGEYSSQCTLTVHDSGTPSAVDLGLSVKWGSQNLGASQPYRYGDYYAWAETSCKEFFSPNNYKYADLSSGSTVFTKYCRTSLYGHQDNLLTLELQDDAARQVAGGTWRIPSRAEWQELMNPANCTWTWYDNYQSTGISGFLVASIKPGYEGTSIFLPAAGYREDSILSGERSSCVYHTSELSPDLDFQCLSVSVRSDFNPSTSSGFGNSQKYNARPVRAVCD